ncbi:MAG: hypothetical protein R3B54_00910 [Bdellovibrionota bacterium]
MILEPVPSDVAVAGLRSVKTVCLTTHSTLSELQSRLIEGIQTYILKTHLPVNELTRIEPQQLAEAVSDPHFRERIIKACVLAACIDGEMDSKAVAQTKLFADALGVVPDLITTARHLAEGQIALSRIDIIRRSLPGVKIRQVVREKGILKMLKQALPLVGFRLPDVTRRYRALADYPEGTLGREYMHYIEKNKFPLPGEKGSGPEIIVIHDCLHILGDYGTTASEEIEIAAFQAGCQAEDPIYGILFGLAQYHLNVRMAPVAPAQSLQGDPKALLAAFTRGCRVKRDMWRDFDPWNYFARPVTELRHEFGILPKDAPP